MPGVSIIELPLSKEDGQRCHICQSIREKIEMALENAALASTCIVVEEGNSPPELHFTCGPHRKGVVKGLMAKYGPEEEED